MILNDMTHYNNIYKPCTSVLYLAKGERWLSQSDPDLPIQITPSNEMLALEKYLAAVNSNSVIPSSINPKNMASGTSDLVRLTNQAFIK